MKETTCIDKETVWNPKYNFFKATGRMRILGNI
jgi:hypothetical protein